MTTNLEREADKIGLRLNSEEMKVMIMREATMFPPIIIGHQTAEGLNISHIWVVKWKQM